MKLTNNILIAVFLSACGVDYELKGERPDVNPGDITECPFTPIANTNISSYDCNPVFQEENGDVGSVGFYATEVMGHPFYQMWYTSRDSEEFGTYAMNYAVSADGTNWNTHPQNPLFASDSTAWDKDSVAGQVVVWDPIDAQYVMAYQGFTLGANSFDPGIWGLGIATSPDGVSWTRAADPAINFNDFDPFFGGDLISPCWPLTITLNNRGSFRGYMAATRAEDAFFGSGTDACHIYAMNSADGRTWTIEQDQPIFEAGTGTDSAGFISASVVEFRNKLYMFYVGFSEWEPNDGYRTATNRTLHLATSEDNGMTWTRDPSNPLPITSSLNEVSHVAAQVIGNRIHLWVKDNYDGKQAVGYFLYEPERTEEVESEEP